MSKEPAVTEPATVTEPAAIATPTARQQFHRYLKDRGAIEGAANGEALLDAQIADIMAAETPDDLWAAMRLDGLTALKDMDNGALITITGYRLSLGSGEYKVPAYAIIDAFDTRTGENITLDSGVERVLGFLRAVESGHAGLTFPVAVKIDKKTTANGTAVTFVKP